MAPVGNGFTVTAGDLSFILKQIKISERHAATLKPSDPCGTLVQQAGDGIPDTQQIPDRLTSYGLRTVDGSCNNLFADTTWDKITPLNNNGVAAANSTAKRSRFGSADEPFPRLTTPKFSAAEGRPADFFGPGDPGSASSSYAQKKGNVYDSQPRVVSNLIVDQTSTNPAAIAAAGKPIRTQGNPGKFPCTVDPDPTATPAVLGSPAGCVPTGKTLDIPNVTTDVGLSPPFNSLFTFFGQFFDHGVDQTVKSGGTIFVPLKADDPLITVGPDGIPCNTTTKAHCDEVPPGQRFMVLTRAQNQPGPDGILGDDPATPAADESADDIQDANNTDSPWVDQSQTYTSHASQQVFLREYSDKDSGPDGKFGTPDDVALGSPNSTTPCPCPAAVVSTGNLLGGLAPGQTYLNSPDGTTGMATWASVKKQSALKLGLLLKDKDVLNVPMLATDPYGQFLPGRHGLPQYVTKSGLVEGDLANPVAVPADVLYFDTPFLTDIAHNADPGPVGPCTSPGVPTGCLSPDADNTPSADFAKQPAGTYDDEMLNAHFIAGDGRVNENIALTTIHQIFHSEHDRLVADITKTLTDPANSALLTDYLNVSPNSTDDNVRTFTYGARLFQAARFVTEMEYQHLVFEEFARKMEPAIRPFHVYSPDINPSINAEFAHAVYRFGHSMLDDEVARVVVDPVTHAITKNNSIPLLTAFLNPPEYFNNGNGGSYTPEQAAGAVAMGSADQIGNEIDEFVVQTLRNNLLGLPLDLPTLNMTRAREAGVPPLNVVRRQLFAQTGDGRLTPYHDWSEYGQNIKHPESLINFVAAYGTHPTITHPGPDGVVGTADDGPAPTLKSRRDAARAIVDPRPASNGPDGLPNTADDVPADVQPGDAADFMFGTGTWAGKETGLNSVDLWIGGLAENTQINGGLLGSTFTYVFQTQLENLQDGDRLYYLNRTPGMNLRTQLEGNSFAEMIQRNTDGTDSLKADVFGSADCKFQLANIHPYTGAPTSSGQPAITTAGAVDDDPSTPSCDENQLLILQGNGAVAYRTTNNIDPSGINGQAVYMGTPGGDKVVGGVDNDTFWGGDGGDILAGNFGDDVILGGNGNDIETDAGGADVLKGGPGNDFSDGGSGDDIFMGADGQDFIDGGANDNESFAGPGNDFVIAGAGADAVFGDGGDDWIEGGTGQDLLQGDHGAPFFDDPAETAPGNDIFVGQTGENDYDTEGGDDLMSQNAAIDRNAGAGGFDWAIHQYDTVGGNDDLLINQQLAGLPLPVVVNRDRWQETEADSGSNFNDVIRGDSLERIVGGFGFSGCDALDPAGVDRIKGLGDYVKKFPTPVADVIAVSPLGYCPLKGAPVSPTNPVAGGVWAEGNILFGGGGSDVIEGRGNQDIIDGDQAVRVAISVRTNADGTGPELGRTDLMEGTAQAGGNFGLGTSGMTLKQAVSSGLVDPGQLVAVREVVDPNGGLVGANPNNAALQSDCPAPTADPAITDPALVDPVVGSTVKLTAAIKNCDTAVFSAGPGAYDVKANADGSVTVTDTASAAALAAGTPFPKGDGIDTLWNVENLRFCIHNDPVTKLCDAFTDVSVAPVAAVTPTSLAFADQGIGTTSTAKNITVTNTGLRDLVVSGVTVSGANPGSFTANPAAGCSSVAAGASCTVAVQFAPTTLGPKSASVDIADNAAGSPHKVAVTGTGVAVAPGAPTIGTAVRGNTTATVNWSPPASDGGSAITGYQVQVLLNGTTTQVGALRAPVGTATSLTVTGLTNGTAYQFRVRAINAVGAGAFSAASNAVTPATVPGAPTIRTANNGTNGGPIEAVANWLAPGSTGGSPITNYQVIALHMSSPAANATVLGQTTSGLVAQNLRTLDMPLPVAGTYRFQVVAINSVGTSTPSARSNAVAGR